jgi:hypothetical protein
MARELGVNEIVIRTPFGVEHDDPAVRAVSVRQEGSYKFVRWSGEWCTPARRNAAAEVSPELEVLFKHSWEQRFYDNGPHLEDRSDRPTCEWLYQNITLDGAGRLMPCCMAPGKIEKPLVFANFDSAADSINSPMATLARLSFSNRHSYEGKAQDVPEKARPFCANCTEKPQTYGLTNVAGDIRALDSLSAVPHSLRWGLTHWA